MARQSASAPPRNTPDTSFWRKLAIFLGCVPVWIETKGSSANRNDARSSRPATPPRGQPTAADTSAPSSVRKRSKAGSADPLGHPTSATASATSLIGTVRGIPMTDTAFGGGSGANDAAGAELEAGHVRDKGDLPAPGSRPARQLGQSDAAEVPLQAKQRREVGQELQRAPSVGVDSAGGGGGSVPGSPTGLGAASTKHAAVGAPEAGQGHRPGGPAHAHPQPSPLGGLPRSPSRAYHSHSGATAFSPEAEAAAAAGGRSGGGGGGAPSGDLSPRSGPSGGASPRGTLGGYGHVPSLRLAATMAAAQQAAAAAAAAAAEAGAGPASGGVVEEEKEKGGLRGGSGRGLAERAVKERAGSAGTSPALSQSSRARMALHKPPALRVEGHGSDEEEGEEEQGERRAREALLGARGSMGRATPPSPTGLTTVGSITLFNTAAVTAAALSPSPSVSRDNAVTSAPRSPPQAGGKTRQSNSAAPRPAAHNPTHTPSPLSPRGSTAGTRQGPGAAAAAAANPAPGPTRHSVGKPGTDRAPTGHTHSHHHHVHHNPLAEAYSPASSASAARAAAEGVAAAASGGPSRVHSLYGTAGGLAAAPAPAAAVSSLSDVSPVAAAAMQQHSRRGSVVEGPQLPAARSTSGAGLPTGPKDSRTGSVAAAGSGIAPPAVSDDGDGSATWRAVHLGLEDLQRLAGLEGDSSGGESDRDSPGRVPGGGAGCEEAAGAGGYMQGAVGAGAGARKIGWVSAAPPGPWEVGAGRADERDEEEGEYEVEAGGGLRHIQEEEEEEDYEEWRVHDGTTDSEEEEGEGPEEGSREWAARRQGSSVASLPPAASAAYGRPPAGPVVAHRMLQQHQQQQQAHAYSSGPSSGRGSGGRSTGGGGGEWDRQRETEAAALAAAMEAYYRAGGGGGGGGSYGNGGRGGRRSSTGGGPGLISPARSAASFISRQGSMVAPGPFGGWGRAGSGAHSHHLAAPGHGPGQGHSPGLSRAASVSSHYSLGSSYHAGLAAGPGGNASYNGGGAGRGLGAPASPAVSVSAQSFSYARGSNALHQHQHHQHQQQQGPPSGLQRRASTIVPGSSSFGMGVQQSYGSMTQQNMYGSSLGARGYAGAASPIMSGGVSLASGGASRAASFVAGPGPMGGLVQRAGSMVVMAGGPSCNGSMTAGHGGGGGGGPAPLMSSIMLAKRQALMAATGGGGGGGGW